MADDSFPKSSRRTTKIVMYSTLVLSWTMAFYGIFHGQGGDVVPWAVFLMTSVIGGYMGVGHFDYRLAAKMQMARSSGFGFGGLPDVSSAPTGDANTDQPDPPTNELGIVR